MAAGGLGLRRLPAATTVSNAAHLTVGTALAGLAYQRLGGALGEDALDPANFGPLVAFLALLPLVVNATFYLELALGRSLAWIAAQLASRGEASLEASSAG